MGNTACNSKSWPFTALLLVLCAQFTSYPADGDFERWFSIPSRRTITSVEQADDGSVWVGWEYYGVGRAASDGSVKEFKSLFGKGAADILVQSNEALVATIGDRSLVRLAANGQITWSVGVDGYIKDLAKQRDGKALLAGSFTRIGGIPRPYIARLNQDGTLDDSFQPALLIGGSYAQLSVEDANGNIVVVGDFEAVGEDPRNGFARFSPQGVLDPNFNPGLTHFGLVRGRDFGTLSAAANGDVLATWTDPNYPAEPTNYIARFDRSGAVVQVFTSLAFGNQLLMPESGNVWMQEDGRLLVANSFYFGETVPGAVRIIRFHRDGTLDDTYSTFFQPGGSFSLTRLWHGPNAQTFLSGRGFLTDTNFLFQVKNSVFIPQVRLLEISPVGSNRASIALSSTSAGQAVLEASTEFTKWFPLSTNPITAGTNRLVQTMDQKKMFFRAVVRP